MLGHTHIHVPLYILVYKHAHACMYACMHIDRIICIFTHMDVRTFCVYSVLSLRATGDAFNIDMPTSKHELSFALEQVISRAGSHKQETHILTGNARHCLVVFVVVVIVKMFGLRGTILGCPASQISCGLAVLSDGSARGSKYLHVEFVAQAIPRSPLLAT